MATAARTGRRAPKLVTELPAPPVRVEGAATRRTSRGAAAVAAAVALGVAARFFTPAHLWLDEALTVNIAKLPLGRIPEALRHDGAPPLYYFLLHGWMRLFGSGDFAVRALSGLFGVAALPLVWVSTRRLARPLPDPRSVAWAAVVLLAASPFHIRYSTEARMYSLAVVLVLLAAIALSRLHDGPSALAAAGLALVTGLLLLTHYWTLYLGFVVAAALAYRAWRSPEGEARAASRRSLVALAAGTVLFLPWLPSTLYQSQHTGTPWGSPGLPRVLADSVFHFAGGYWDPALGLGLAYFALIALAVWGRGVDDCHIELDLRGRSPGRELALVTFGTLLTAVVAGQLTRSAFAVRYAAVVFPLLLMLVALGTGALLSRRLRAAVLAGAVILGFAAAVPNATGDRTTAGRVATALRQRAQPGDVVAYCPDQLGPSVNRLLPEGRFEQLTFPRATPPTFVDWVGYAAANRSTRVTDYAAMLLERAGPQRQVWVVWAPGYRTLGTKCQLLLSELQRARPEQRVVKISGRYFERPGLVRYPPA